MEEIYDRGYILCLDWIILSYFEYLKGDICSIVFVIDGPWDTDRFIVERHRALDQS